MFGFLEVHPPLAAISFGLLTGALIAETLAFLFKDQEHRLQLISVFNLVGAAIFSVFGFTGGLLASQSLPDQLSDAVSFHFTMARIAMIVLLMTALWSCLLPWVKDNLKSIFRLVMLVSIIISFGLYVVVGRAGSSLRQARIQTGYGLTGTGSESSVR